MKRFLRYLRHALRKRRLVTTTQSGSLGPALGVAFTATMIVLGWLAPGPLVRLENGVLDAQFKLRDVRSVGREIVIVSIDEKSLEELGRWPWSRDRLAQLVSVIERDRPKVIGLDILLVEREATALARALKEIATETHLTGADSAALQQILDKTLSAVDTDAQLAASLAAAGNVVLAVPFFVPMASSGQESFLAPVSADDTLIKRSEFMLIRQVQHGETLEPYRATTVRPPLKLFADKAVGLGHVYSLPDLDGVTRHEYLALRYGDAYYPSFALEVARAYLGVARDRMSLTLGEGAQVGDVVIPMDQKARLLINYAGREWTFPSFSATDVIHGRVPAGIFTDRAVLVGTAALSTYDRQTTPYSANFSGVEKHATVVENILHRQFLKKTVWFSLLESGVILLLGLTVTFLLRRGQALFGTLATAAVVVGYGAGAQYLFVARGLCIPVFTPVLTVMLVFVVMTVFNFVTKERQVKEIRAMFSSYVSPQVVAELIKAPSKATVGGQRKELTMLFADLVNFTAFSEKHSAEDVVAQLNEYLGAMTEVIFRWNGTLDKFVGDEIVVFWGAPLDQPDHTELAVKCALHMRQKLGELREKWRAEGRFLLDNGIGINTGMAVVGNIGATGKKMDYTAIGDQVNVAARFQGLTRKFGCPIVLTESTAERIKKLIDVQERGDNQGRLGHVSLRKLGSVRVRGKETFVGAYTVESLKRNESSRVDEAAPDNPVEMTER